jgi:hypothetical protein
MKKIQLTSRTRTPKPSFTSLSPDDVARVRGGEARLNTGSVNPVAVSRDRALGNL